MKSLGAVLQRAMAVVMMVAVLAPLAVAQTASVN